MFQWKLSPLVACFFLYCLVTVDSHPFPMLSFDILGSAMHPTVVHYSSQMLDSRYKLTAVLSLCLLMSAAKFTRIEIYICRNKSLSKKAQIYDVSYMPRQAVSLVGKSSTHRRGCGRPWARKIPLLRATRLRLTCVTEWCSLENYALLTPDR